MMLAVEPGLYLAPGDEQPLGGTTGRSLRNVVVRREYIGMAARLEDTVLVQSGGIAAHVLTAQVPLTFPKAPV